MTDLPLTPALFLDEPALRTNIEKVATRLKAKGIALRPHLKTAKSLDVAKILQEHGADRWTVSTLKEAEYFAAGGLTDFIYAVTLAPSKLPQVSALNRDGANVKVIIDSLATANYLRDNPQGTNNGAARLGVYLEIDVDGHRTGLTAEDDDLAEIARVIDSAPHLALLGLMSHGGGAAYAANSPAEHIAACEQERERVLAVASKLRENGITVNEISVGSSPFAQFAENLEGLTEIRAGVYMFEDLFQANLGACEQQDIAATVLATVISHSKRLNRVVIDAGGLALSKDRSTQSQPNDCGYGLLRSFTGEFLDELFIEGVSQEHGYVTTRDQSALDFSKYPIGTLLHVLPNHTCMTCAAFEGYHVTDGTKALKWWPRSNRW
ncbi:alanine racemase [Rhodobacteraceae bacterium RKSG542]|uniref:alanine racemase n=1 Tax=Pseudovibrio flavus TaxID=2529854 RepID=UPI0012BC9A95|nr:alanine racemase [Pseudovibrio flavus]MTI16126.1 alanine racemase [Pseudovibrio flavus]